MLLISLFGTAVGSLLTGLASGVAGGLALLFIGRIIDGASGASVSVAQASVADVAAPRDRARLMGLLGAAFGVGFVAGPAIGAVGALVAPQVPFYIAAAISFANAIVAIRRLPETSPEHRRPIIRPAAVGADMVVELDDVELEAEIERVGTLDGPQPGTPLEAARVTGSEVRVDVPVIIRLITVSFVGMVAFSGFEATFALLTDARFGLKLSGTGAVFTVIGLALVAVQVGVVGRVNDRLGESNTLRAGLVANACGLALLAVDGGWLTLVPSLLLLVLGQGLHHADAVVGRRRAGRTGPGELAGLAAVGRRPGPGAGPDPRRRDLPARRRRRPLRHRRGAGARRAGAGARHRHRIGCPPPQPFWR